MDADLANIDMDIINDAEAAANSGTSDACPEYDERVRIISAYRQKSKSGYVGLRNQGGTCYMDSLLQTLFMTPAFRRALLGWDIQPGPDPAKNIALQLQHLFSRLQLSEHGAVETKALTASFGWTARDTFTQHDVQELNRVLFEAVQKYIQHTGIADFISRLYDGQMVDYIACQRCGGGRERLDVYQDLQLAVRGMANVEAALEAFSQPELLDGGNQWRCDSCGQLSDAKKGLRLHTTPPILTLQLRRFDFDLERLERVKVYDHIRVPLVLDVTPWIPAERRGEDPEANLYDLYSVLLHSGSALAGHYYAYIRNLATDRWYKFNDEQVDEITLETVMQCIHPTPEQAAEQAQAQPAEPAAGAEPLIGPLFEGENRPASAYVGAQPYMLVYHARAHPVGEYNAAVLPSLMEVIAKENEEILRLKADYERVKDLLELKVFYTAVQGEEAHVDDFKWVVANAHDPVGAVTAAALRTLTAAGALDDTVPASCYRLREYNESKRVFGRTFGGSDDIPIEKLGWAAKKKLVLERKSGEEEAWVEHDKEELRLRALQFVPEGDVWKGRDVTVPGDATVADLRRRLSALLDIPDERLLVSYRASPLNGVFLEPGIMLDRHLQNDLTMVPDERLYVEDAAECERTETGAYRSLGMQHIESVHFKTIRFNCLEEDEPSQCLSFDVRRTFVDLKAAIGQRLNVDPAEFRLKKSKKATVEVCGDMHSSLRWAGVSDDYVVYVELGRPLDPNELSVSVYQWIAPTADRGEDLVFLFKHVTNRDTPLTEFRRVLSEKLEIPPEYMRVREISGSQMRGVLYRPTLRDHFGKGNAPAVAVQRTTVPDTATENSVILLVSKFCPAAKAVTQPKQEEVIVDKAATVADLKRLLCEKYGLEKVTLAKAFSAYFGQQPPPRLFFDFIRSMTLDEYHRSGITKHPLGLKDNDNVVFMEGDEVTTAQPPAAARGPGKKKGDGDADEPGKSKSTRYQERGIRIVTEFDTPAPAEAPSAFEGIDESSDARPTGGAQPPAAAEPGERNFDIGSEQCDSVFRTFEYHASMAGDLDSACPICCDSFDPGVLVGVTPCSHIFHPECFHQWWAMKGTCPLCATAL